MKNNIYLLSSKKVGGAINLPVMEIKYINQNINFEEYDALVITSKYALTSIDSFASTWKEKPIYAIAPQTAKVVKELDGNLKFTGTTSNGNDFAFEIIERLKNKKVLYLRGEKAVSSLNDILNKANIKCDDIVVYKSICKEFGTKQILPKDSTIIFSSPSTIECFFKSYNWDESFKAIAFGRITANYLPKEIKVYIAKNTSLKDCILVAKELNQPPVS